MKEKTKSITKYLIAMLLMLIIVPCILMFVGCTNPDATQGGQDTDINDGNSDGTDEGTEGNEDQEPEVTEVVYVPIGDSEMKDFLKVYLYSDGRFVLSQQGVDDRFSYEYLEIRLTGTYNESSFKIDKAEQIEKLYGKDYITTDLTNEMEDMSQMVKILNENAVFFVDVILVREGMASDEIAFIGSPFKMIQGYDIKLQESETNIDLETLKSKMSIGIIYGDGTQTELGSENIINVSQYDLTQAGDYTLTVTIAPDLQNLESTFEVQILVKVVDPTVPEEKEDSLNFNYKGTTNDIFLPINSTIDDLMLLIEGKCEVYLSSESWEDAVAVTKEMIVNFDSTNAGVFNIIVEYKGARGVLTDVCFYNPEDIKIKEYKLYGPANEVNFPVGQTEDNFFMNHMFVITLTNGEMLVNTNMPMEGFAEGWTMTYSMNGETVEFSEIVSTSGVKEFSYVFTKDGKTLTINDVIFVYDDYSLVATGVSEKYNISEFTLESDNTINYNGGYVLVFFNNKPVIDNPEESGYIEGLDYIKIMISDENFIDYEIVDGQIQGGEVVFDIDICRIKTTYTTKGI